MATHTIEVDDDVMRLLKERAEPFVDSPNDVLRRLLFGDGKASAKPAARKSQAERKGVLLDLPWNIPRALEQTLQVVHLVKGSSRSRSDATRVVARAKGIAPQTVTDKYCRQLGMTAEEFDELLLEASQSKLRRALKNKYPDHVNVIDQVLGELQ